VSATSLHEDAADLAAATVDEHRAYRSLMEELEAVDWYAQRIDATADSALKEVLRHNRDEEKEHAAMVLEWLRRRDPVLDGHLRRYLFTEGPLGKLEAAAESGAAAQSNGSGIGLGVGSLRARG
jgi:hypothetical protein